MKILIIEDESILAKVLEEKFRKSNFDVRIAGDGERALELTQSWQPDVIALDLMLPKMDGFQYLNEIKSADSLKRIPVIVISNLSEDENIKKAMALGAVDYFVKSNHPVNEIVEKVKSVLMKSK